MHHYPQDPVVQVSLISNNLELQRSVHEQWRMDGNFQENRDFCDLIIHKKSEICLHVGVFFVLNHSSLKCEFLSSGHLK